jgi:anaerobic magnesium-protoporphyrin IX monomethyl ester cyclase
MTDVLLGQAYYLRFDPKLWEARQPYAPLGALYAAACLRERGLGVALFDAMLAASEAEWETALDRHRPALAVLFEDSFNYLSKMCLLRMRQAAFTMIDAARARGCPIVVAGSDATDHPDLYLARGVAAVIAGEGELTLTELAAAVTRAPGTPLESIQGLVLRRPDGSLARTPARAFARDLDSLPRPAWDLVDVDRYRRLWRDRHGYFSMNAVTTRGCPYSCNWCARPVHGQRYVSRSPEHVVSEIAWLKRAYAPDHLSFSDDIFGLRPGWIERFAQFAVESGAVVPFKCLMRADLVDERVTPALRAAGCRTVWIGAESGSQRILDAMDKGLRVEQIERATRLLHAQGIEVGFFLQFGYPGETRADIAQTMALVRRCRPDDIGISVSYPLPGTKFYERVRAELTAKQNWDDSSDLAMMYRGPYSTGFYRALHRVVHAEFRLRRALDDLARVARRPGSWRRTHLRACASALRQAAVLPVARARLSRIEHAESRAAWVGQSALGNQHSAIR